MPYVEEDTSVAERLVCYYIRHEEWSLMSSASGGAGVAGVGVKSLLGSVAVLPRDSLN